MECSVVFTATARINDKVQRLSFRVFPLSSSLFPLSSRSLCLITLVWQMQASWLLLSKHLTLKGKIEFEERSRMSLRNRLCWGVVVIPMTKIFPWPGGRDRVQGPRKGSLTGFALGRQRTQVWGGETIEVGLSASTKALRPQEDMRAAGNCQMQKGPPGAWVLGCWGAGETMTDPTAQEAGIWGNPGEERGAQPWQKWIALRAQSCFKGNINRVTFSPHLSLRTKIHTSFSFQHQALRRGLEKFGNFFLCEQVESHLQSRNQRTR